MSPIKLLKCFGLGTKCIVQINYFAHALQSAVLPLNSSLPWKNVDQSKKK